MRAIPSALYTQLVAGEMIRTEILVWIGGRDRNTGALEYIGFWSGADHQNFTIYSQTRTYYGAGAMISMEPITQEGGLIVREHEIDLSPLADEVVQALRIYDPKLCPAEIHEVIYNPNNGRMIGSPTRIFKGRVVGTPIFEDAEGAGGSTASLRLASAAWELTQTLSLKKSQASLSARSLNDTFRSEITTSGAIETAWGEKTGKATATPDAQKAALDAVIKGFGRYGNKG